MVLPLGCLELKEMRDSSSSLCVYSWSLERKSENEVEGNLGAADQFSGGVVCPHPAQYPVEPL